MKKQEYEEQIGALQRENRILRKKLQRSEENRIILEESRDKHIYLLNVKNKELQQSREAIQESEEKYRTVVERANDGIAIVQDMKIKYCNSQFAMMRGTTIEDIEGASILLFVPDENQEEIMSLSYRRQLGENIPGRYETVFASKDERIVHVEVNAASIHYQGAAAELLIVRDITSRKQAEERNKYLAFHDALTNLPNRMFFHERMVDAMTRAALANKFATLLYMDLDRFKPINDRLGHAVGDLVLKETAIRLRECVRGQDMVSRIGGDEFAIILEEIDGIEDIENVAQRVILSLSQPFVFNDKNCQIGTSMGISIYPFDGTDKDTLLRKADMAMYNSKQNGRNNYTFYCNLY